MKLPAPTERLAFRAWRDDDLPFARALFGDPRVTALVGGPFDDAAVAARLTAEIAMGREHAIQYWPIVARGDGTPLGCCGLRPRAATIHELGFYLLPTHWGHGYAVEAARAVIAHAFDVLGVTELFGGHHPDNHASAAVLRRLGFTYTHREVYPPTGLSHPGYKLPR